MSVVTLRWNVLGTIGLVLMLAACKMPKKFAPVHRKLPLPNASTLLEYTDDSNRVLRAQVMAFDPEYTAFQLYREQGPPALSTSWNIEIMADALAGAPALLTAFEPQDTRLNNHTALCLNRKALYQVFMHSTLDLSLEKSIKAYQANGDSLLLFLPLIQGSFSYLRQQDYLMAFNGKPRIVPSEVVQERRAHLRLGSVHPALPNPLLFAWNDYAGNNWSLARYWQYDSLPVMPELKPGSFIDYQYYRPLQLPDGKWQYRTDTLRVDFLQADTLIRTRVQRIGQAPGPDAGEVRYHYHPKTGKGLFSAPSPFPPPGFCLQDTILPRLFSDGFALFPSVSGKKSLTASLVLNNLGNHVWSHSCHVNGMVQELNGFKVQSEDGSMETGFIAYGNTPFVLSYREGMHRLEMIAVCTEKKGCVQKRRP
jgi:hypothetical protein